MRPFLWALVLGAASTLPLFAQGAGSSLPIAPSQASPYAPGSIIFSVTAPPSIIVETPAGRGGAPSNPVTAPGAEGVADGAAPAAGAGGLPGGGGPSDLAADARAARETSAHPSSVAPPGAADDEMVGYASWYGPKFQGRLTADGEIYNMYGLTAAHRTLPFGTLVRVTDLITGKSVVVRINDRGPFVAGRIIDLSKSAAEIIGMPGIAKVRLQIVGRATATEFEPTQTAELAAAHLSASGPSRAALAAATGEGASGGRQGGVGLAVTVSDVSAGRRLSAGQSNTPRLVPITELTAQANGISPATPGGLAPTPRNPAAPSTATPVAATANGVTPAAIVAPTVAAPTTAATAVAPPASRAPSAEATPEPVATATSEAAASTPATGAAAEAGAAAAPTRAAPVAATANGVAPASATPSTGTGSGPAGFAVQVGAFELPTNAARLEHLLISKGFTPQAEQVGRFTRVIIPNVSALQVAPTKSRLAAIGITNVIVREE